LAEERIGDARELSLDGLRALLQLVAVIN
jgi:hypothetical protein